MATVPIFVRPNNGTASFCLQPLRRAWPSAASFCWRSALVFGQTVRHEFVNFDDDEYVYENPQVARGLTAQGIVWAFTTAMPATGIR